MEVQQTMSLRHTSLAEVRQKYEKVGTGYFILQHSPHAQSPSTPSRFNLFSTLTAAHPPHLPHSLPSLDAQVTVDSAPQVGHLSIISEASSPLSSARGQFDSSGFHSLDASSVARDADKHEWSDVSDNEHENEIGPSPQLLRTPAVGGWLVKVWRAGKRAQPGQGAMEEGQTRKRSQGVQ
jgi:hypothetical protein